MINNKRGEIEIDPAQLVLVIGMVIAICLSLYLLFQIINLPTTLVCNQSIIENNYTTITTNTNSYPIYYQNITNITSVNYIYENHTNYFNCSTRVIESSYFNGTTIRDITLYNVTIVNSTILNSTII